MALKTDDAFAGEIVLLKHILARYCIKSRECIRRWMRPRGEKGGRGFPKPVKPEGSRAVSRWRVADILRWEAEELGITPAS